MEAKEKEELRKAAKEMREKLEVAKKDLALLGALLTDEVRRARERDIRELEAKVAILENALKSL